MSPINRRDYTKNPITFSNDQQLVKFIVGPGSVPQELSIDSDDYIVTIKGTETSLNIKVDSIKKKSDCTPNDLTNYIDMINHQSEKRKSLGIPVTKFDAYIDSIMNDGQDVLFLGSANFRVIECNHVNHSYVIEFKMQRHALNPRTMYVMIRNMLPGIRMHWKRWNIRYTNITLIAVPSKNQSINDLMMMGFCPTDKDYMVLCWSRYIQYYKGSRPSCPIVTFVHHQKIEFGTQ